MKRMKIKKIIVIFPVILLLVFTVSLSLAGCKPAAVQETAEQTTSAETVEAETSEEVTAETQTDPGVEEFNPDDFGKDRITGNINMFTGIELSGDVLAQRPIAVMVENTPDARPQSGLVNADVVFEVEDEYGITRFVAVFSSYDADLVGPVRSARPYYAEIAASFDPYMFSGVHIPIFLKLLRILAWIIFLLLVIQAVSHP